MEWLSKVPKVTQICIHGLRFEPSAAHCQGSVMEDMERLHLLLNSKSHELSKYPGCINLWSLSGKAPICHFLPIMKSSPTSFQSEAAVGQAKLAVCSWKRALPKVMV